MPLVHIINHINDIAWFLLHPKFVPKLFLYEMLQLINKTVHNFPLIAFEKADFVEKRRHHVLAGPCPL
jgi:hypothetical protein